jgi:beta-N-acetylhexosaminidase
MDLVSTCGQLVIGGFRGTSLPAQLTSALRRRRRGGVILFKHNVEGGPEQVAALTREVHAAAPDTPFVGIDQEGGRIARLHAPMLEVPSMRTVASWGDASFAERIARAVGTELAALGFTINFAPVLDVNTCAQNPIIGDRSFGEDADVCAQFGVAWIRGLQSAGLLACGKHFPGHGDTTKDSHVDLPEVDQARDRLERIELAPFRAACAAGVASMMTAHVVYTALDPSLPATLSRVSCTELRESVGFHGMLITDDLGMQAIAARWSIEDASVQAVGAGCDVLLICRSEQDQEAAVEALVREAQVSPTFRKRCEQAYARSLEARGKIAARPLDDEAIAGIVGGAESRGVATQIEERLTR